MVFINFALEINWRLTSGMKVKAIICFRLNFDVQQFFNLRLQDIKALKSPLINCNKIVEGFYLKLYKKLKIMQLDLSRKFRTLKD